MSEANGAIQVVKKVQDQAKRDGQAAVALIQAAQLPEPDSSKTLGTRISLRI